MLFKDFVNVVNTYSVSSMLGWTLGHRVVTKQSPVSQKALGFNGEDVGITSEDMFLVNVPTTEFWACLASSGSLRVLVGVEET